MELDPMLLSRIQFGVTIGFHFIFPPITIGLAWLLTYLEFRSNPDHTNPAGQAANLFKKLLALTFAVGVATGIVMEFQFGTNWAHYSKIVGDIFGAPLAAEGVFTFFLESTFMGVYLFGGKRISPKMLKISIFMVALGSTMSAFWILVANSWQQTPSGYTLENGVVLLKSFWEAVFSESMIPRFAHTVTSCFAAASFVMTGVSAWILLRKPSHQGASYALTVSIPVSLAAALLLVFPTGHLHAVQVAETQPTKFAAMEGIVHKGAEENLLVFGIPSTNPEEIHMGIELPGLMKMFLLGSDANVQSIEALHEQGQETPPFAVTFISFHTMVGLGTFFILLTSLANWFLFKRVLPSKKWFMNILVYAAPLPLLAIELGWIVAEVGRQPWIVQGILKTRDAWSGNITGGEVLTSLLMFTGIYALLGVLYLFIFAKTVKKETAELAMEEN